MSDANPRISVVTPCLNDGAYLERAIHSVDAESNPDVEHIVVDGGSTDETSAILERHPAIQPLRATDSGAYAAINHGFEAARGDILAWLNADDFYLSGALPVVQQIFDEYPRIQWLTTGVPLYADAAGRVVHGGEVAGYSRRRAQRPDYTGAVRTLLQQESTFWRRELWDASGASLRSDFDLAADFELWLRFWKTAELFTVNAPLACFRWRADQRSRANQAAYHEDAERALALHGLKRAGPLRTFARRCTLLLRGLPQPALRFVPGRTAQQTVHFERDTERWKLSVRYSIAT